MNPENIHPISFRFSENNRIATFSDGITMSVVESPFISLLQITQEDLDCCTPRDPFNCAIARGLCRTYNSNYAYVTNTTAYVILKTKGRGRELHRFILDKPAKAMVKTLDDDKTYFNPYAISLLPPTGSKTLDAQAKARKRSAKKRQRMTDEEILARAKAQSMSLPPPPAGSKRPPPYSITLRQAARSALKIQKKPAYKAS